MDSNTDLKFKLSYVRDLWHDFCEKHTELYEVTCDEYMHLLASDIDKIDSTMDSKKMILQYINQLDLRRNEVTKEIALLYEVENPTKLSQFIELLNNKGETEIASQLNKLNLVLLDIVEKIQEQNKKNQFFLNKAIMSLNELRESFSGKTNYKTYSSSGMTKNNNTY